MYTKLEEIKARRAALRLEHFQLDADIAEMNRAWLVDGKPESPAYRAEIWADFKAVTLELHKINAAEKLAKEEAQKIKSSSMLDILIHKVKAAGLEHLVKEANRESMAALEGVGMTEAYKS
jgi:hypothetical protein